MSAIDALLVAPEGGALRVVAIRGGRADDAARLEAGPEAVGAVHRARVLRVLPGLRAAFVAIGAEQPALLDIGRAAPEPGSLLTVQVVEAASGGTGGKAARVSRRVAVAGRFVVALPGGKGVAASRRGDAAQAMALAAGLAPPPGVGLLLRRHARDGAAVAAEARLLGAQAQAIAAAEGAERCVLPADPVAALLAEFTAEPVGEIAVGDPVLARRMIAAARERAPELADRIVTAEAAVLDRYGAGDAIAAGPAVPLAGGGRLIIERTAALVAIDVDSADATGRDAIAATNRAAAAEVPRQLRLRDLGGLIVIDFIRRDDDAGARHALRAALERGVAADRRPVAVLGFTAGGVCEVRRGRRGEGT